jgi:CheY-like chemotaxis protein
MGARPTTATREFRASCGVQTLPPILIAEDSDDDFFFFRRALRAGRVENPLLRFRDGSDLVRYLEKIPASEFASASPWLLFVDITMPIMNGFEVLEWLKPWKHADKVNVVVLSGSRRDDDVKRSLALGAKDHLVKPISPGLLAAIVADSTVLAYT